MNKRYYKKKGPSFRERWRCIFCGKLSDPKKFSQTHHLGIYRFIFAGRGKITCELIQKDPFTVQAIKEFLVGRFLELLEQLTGMRYYSQ